MKHLTAILTALALLLTAHPSLSQDDIPDPPEVIPTPVPVPTALPYRYSVPKKLADGWKTGDLRKEKADLQRVTRGVDRIRNGYVPDVHSLLVLKDGKIVLEEYFNGWKPEDPHTLYSVTKSVFSTVFGIARDQGLLELNQKVYDLYPEARSKAGWDGKKDAITVGMLLSMVSGLKCDDGAGWADCGGAKDKSADWLDFTHQLSLVNPPGSTWMYNGTSLTLLSNLIAKKSGMDFQAYASKHLLTPLGIKEQVWKTGPNGIVEVGSGLAWKSRDMAKLGQLYLDKGMWNGKRIVSADWVGLATTSYCKPGTAFNHDYGYLWHIKEMSWKGKKLKVFFANGYHGQGIFVSPEAGLVCVMTADSGNSVIYGLQETLFEDAILGAF